MSHGVGHLQQRIVAEVKKAGNKQTTLETVRWVIWEQEASDSGELPGRLPQTANTSVDRAIKSLARRGDLAMESRPLANLDEWVAHYPNKTLSTAARWLRTQLLPHLAAWLSTRDGPPARFSRSQNEEFAARKLTPDRMESLQSLWANLEPCLRHYYGQTGMDDMFLLLVRGKQLFTPKSGVRTSESLGGLVLRCISEAGLPQDLRDQCQELMDKFLPGTSAKSLEFKSYIRAIAKGVPTSGHCALSEEAEDELYRCRADLLSKLPGFKPPPVSEKKRFPFQLESHPNRPHHSPWLAKVLDHSVFQKFRFLTAG